MEAFKALTFAERWHVRRFLFRGNAPDDLGLAAAAVELAERYERRGQMKWLRWLLPPFTVGAIIAAILTAIEGDLYSAVTWGASALLCAGQLALNPEARPKSVAQSLEASRRVVAQGG